MLGRGEPVDRLPDQPDALQRVVHHADLRIEDPAPDERDHHRRHDVGKQQQAAEYGDARQRLVQQQGDADAEHRLKHDRQEGPHGRLPERVPEQRIAEDEFEVGEPDECAQVRAQRVVAVEGHPHRFGDRIDHEEQRRRYERGDEQQADRAIGQSVAWAHLHSSAGGAGRCSTARPWLTSRAGGCFRGGCRSVPWRPTWRHPAASCCRSPPSAPSARAPSGRARCRPAD